MTAEELVALASAHGVDLQHAARVAAGRPRVSTSLRPPNGQRANGRQSYVIRPPLWSVAELGQAASGVRRVPFLAACFCIAGDRSGYWELWQVLALRGFELRVERGWPAQVLGADGRRRFYLNELAQLVLDEQLNEPVFPAAPVLFAHCLGVTPETWDSGLERRYFVLKEQLAYWVSEAMSDSRA